MEKIEFDRRVAHNTSVLLEALNNDVPLTAILHRVYTWKYAPGELHFNILLRNGFDIIPSLFLGVLANCDANGIDAHEVLNNGEIVDIEIKTSEVRTSRLWAGAQGGLYSGLQNTKTRRVALTSGLAAAYQCYSSENKLSKNMRTVFMITDTDELNTYIDAYEMEGDTVMKYLFLSNCKNRSIKLGSFMKEGHQSSTVVPLEGFDNWKRRIRNKVPTLLKDDFFEETC